MRHLWSRGLLRVAAATLVVLAGCADDPAPTDPPPPSTSPPTTAAAAPPTTAPRTTNRLLTDPSAVLAIDGNRQLDPASMAPVEALVRANQANIRAHLHPVEPQSSELAATSTGTYLAVLRDVFTEDQQRGVALTDPTILRIVIGRITVENPTRAVVEYCYTTNAHLHDINTKKLLEEDEIYSIHFVAAVELHEGAWKVAQHSDFKTYQGSPICLDPIS